MYVGSILFYHHGADGDAEVEIAGEVEIPDGARVNAPAPILELGDDLHRADFWRARYGARGEARDERIQSIVLFFQLPFDDGDEVHHVRIALERHVGRHSHAAVFGHASNVIAPEVDEHHVLSALLLVALQLLGQAQVLFFVASAGSRPGDGVRHHVTSLHPNEHLG